MTARELRSERERTLFAIAVFVSSLVWLVVTISIIGAFYAVAIGLLALVAHALFLAHVSLNGVRLGHDQLPDLHAKVVRASKALGLDHVPEAYVLQGDGLLNAFATKLLSRRCVIILADLVRAAEAAKSIDAEPGTPDVMDFVIAHEVGHLAAGHLKWNAFLLPARIVPWLEYTTDLCGLEVTGNLETSSRAIAVLAAGESGRHVALAAFARQRQASGGFWASVLELNSTHPFLPKRIAALEERMRPGTHRPVGRNVFACILAPIFAPLQAGASASGLMLVIAVIGIMAAVAIPNLVMAVGRAKAKRTMADMRLVASAAEAYATDTNLYPNVRDTEQLAAVLEPTYSKALPRVDGWGKTMRFWAMSGGNGYAIGSAGADGKWEHEDASDYPRGETTESGADIVFANGAFERYPPATAER